MQRLTSFKIKADPFLLCLLAVIAGTSLVPVRGAASALLDNLADFSVALLFFMHGAKLSRTAIMYGVGHWRLHLLVLGSTYILFPTIGLALAALFQGALDPRLIAGLLYLTLLPSTVQSSIAFTAMAGGNVAAAVCSASLSNVIGIALSPLLVGLFMTAHGGGANGSLHSVQAIALQLLVPFIAGHALRSWVAPFIERHKRLQLGVDRGAILLVVYSAFSAAVVAGLWSQLRLVDLLMLLVLSLVLLLLVMGVNVGVARVARLRNEDAIVLLFCGSKKSLVSGVPMAGALFPAAQVGLMILPLMIFHQLQLFLCAALAGRFAGQQHARTASADMRLPRTEEEITAAAQAVGLLIPESCMAGVVDNLALLDSHAARTLGGAQP